MSDGEGSASAASLTREGETDGRALTWAAPGPPAGA